MAVERAATIAETAPTGVPTKLSGNFPILRLYLAGKR
jgi:hypothetical protein